MLKCLTDRYSPDENTLRSCSIMNLRILFKFMSKCSLVTCLHGLESGLCNVGNELDNCTVV